MDQPITPGMVQAAFQVGLVGGVLLGLFIAWLGEKIADIIDRRAQRWLKRRQDERAAELSRLTEQ